MEFVERFQQFLATYVKDEGMLIDIISVPRMGGSADGLRAVSDRIRGDFIVLIADFIADMSLAALVNFHRIKTSDITIALFSASYDESDRKGGVKKVIDEEDQEYIGTDEDGRVMFKVSALELEGSVSLNKPLLHRCSGQFTLRNNASDAGVYVMSHWIMELIMNSKRLTSIRTDLVPYLVSLQFQPEATLRRDVPGLEQRYRPLNAMESWLTDSLTSFQHGKGFTELSEHIMQMVSSPSAPILQRMDSGNAVDESFASTGLNASTAQSRQYQGSRDAIRCYSVFVDVSGSVTEPLPSGVISASICRRITNLQTYMNINRCAVRFCMLFFG